ncbi:L-seryl-tRNA(Sec) kinase [Sphaeramia orbicularis]|uniref:Phosphoseryl-tRNA kinase n=1 Tax=Sphaeramia orbicularis TaxID=375764 RepID=A0A672YC62_9TELE|nr:L-seryl-tRNA(Sec) kinase [Sphaeramia orbicularis]XP_029978398.1 L-seryl-tRNA(Sec) kinase [Sphaeramia orbicularis]
MAAAEEADSIGQVRVCLCVLCGLPAAGKTTLARTILRGTAQHEWRSTVVCYDDLIPDHAFQSRGMEEQTHTEWKLHRQAVLQCIEQFLKNCDVSTDLPVSCKINCTAWERCIQDLLEPQSDNAPLIFLLDDNFYYPSMRYEVYQLARKYSLGFCQVYLHCDLESCTSRNQSRSKPIPAEVILDMSKRLEAPNPQKNSWETNSITLNTTDHFSDSDIQKVMELLSSALTNPLSPVEDHTEQKMADRLKCATSVVHQADQACRRLISEAMKTARENQVPPGQMRSLAAQLNESKAKFLHDLRTQFLQDVHLTDEDVDVDRAVKTAIHVFDSDKKDILLRAMSDYT